MVKTSHESNGKWTIARWRCGRKHGNFLISLYLTVKCCYLLNVIGQIYLMQSFIGTQYSSYGARVLIDLIKGREWHQSGHFPRVTFCDLEAKKLGKNHVYTLQCVLPLNMFLEKIYIFLWFWHVTIAMITVLSLLIWLHRVFLIRSRMHFILSYLRPLDPNPAKFRLDWEKHDREFVDSYLGYDGLFIIRLISANCGGMLAGELVYSLWQDFRNPRPPTAEKCGGTVNREHTCGCFTMPVHENAPDWSVPPVPGDYQPVARESSFWRTMDSMPNHRSQFTRGHLSPSFSRRKYIMVKRDTTQSFHTDSQHKFLPSGLKHAPLGADPDQSTHSTATNMSTGQNFQNGQLNDDIV